MYNIKAVGLTELDILALSLAMKKDVDFEFTIYEKAVGYNGWLVLPSDLCNFLIGSKEETTELRCTGSDFVRTFKRDQFPEIYIQTPWHYLVKSDHPVTLVGRLVCMKKYLGAEDKETIGIVDQYYNYADHLQGLYYLNGAVCNRETYLRLCLDYQPRG